MSAKHPFYKQHPCTAFVLVQQDYMVQLKRMSETEFESRFHELGELFQVAPFLAYETSTVYPENKEEPSKCDNNEQVSGYELYLVSIVVYSVSSVFVLYTLGYIFTTLRSGQDEEVKLMNRLTIALSLVTTFSIVELNPCYDPTASFGPDRNSLLADWQHHEKVFLVGIAVKNIADAALFLLLSNASVSRKLDRLSCCRKATETPT